MAFIIMLGCIAKHSVIIADLYLHTRVLALFQPVGHLSSSSIACLRGVIDNP